MIDKIERIKKVFENTPAYGVAEYDYEYSYDYLKLKKSL